MLAHIVKSRYIEGRRRTRMWSTCLSSIYCRDSAGFKEYSQQEKTYNKNGINWRNASYEKDPGFITERNTAYDTSFCIRRSRFRHGCIRHNFYGRRIK